MCVGCGEYKPKKELIRILKDETGFCLDCTGRKNGRGAYICSNPACMEKCIQGHGLERSFKEKISVQTYETLKQAFDEMMESERIGFHDR